MRIRTVTYRKLQTLEGFSNEAIEATADVGENEYPDDVLGSLKEWVQDHLDNPKGTNYSIYSQARDLAKDVDLLEKRKNELVKFINEVKGRVDDFTQLESLPF